MIRELFSKANEPLQLSFDQGGFLIDALLLFSYGFMVPKEQEAELKGRAMSGIKAHWTREFPYDEEMGQAMTEFFLARGVERKTIDSILKEVEANQVIRLRCQLKEVPSNYRFPLIPYFISLLRGERRPQLVSFKKYRRMPAHVASSLPRRIWGVFRNGTVVSLGLNWTPRFTGRIFLPIRYSAWLLPRIAAHEFGHCMGLGDAYGAWYRGYSEAPGTEHYLMNSNSVLHAEEFKMVLRAQARRKMQHFPQNITWKEIKSRLSSKWKRISADKNKRR